MYAIVREQRFDPGRLAEAKEALDEFEAMHAEHPGYAGFVAVDVGDARQITITLWESKEHAEAGRVALGPRVQHRLEPLLTEPSALLGVGEVAAGDLIRR